MEEPSYQPGSSPVYTMRGAHPRPVPGWQRTGPSWRGPLILLAVMFGWMIIVIALAGLAAPAGSGAPIKVGLGVVVTPTGGWYSAADRWDVGPNAVSLQKSGALVAFAAESFTGTTAALLSEQIDSLKQDFSSFRELPESPATLAGDVPAAKVLFSGVSNSSRLEGEIVVATTAGTGVIMLAMASSDQLASVQRDLDDMLRTMQVPR